MIFDHVPILLIDDDDVDIITVRKAFQKNEITNPLYVTHDGEEALAFLRQAPPYEAAPVPGLILLDLNMPVMDGLTFKQTIKDDPQVIVIPIVVLTTSQDDVDMVESYRLGAAGYVTKPTEFDEFVETVRSFQHYWERNTPSPALPLDDE